ncbi:hypothetical protein SALBM135S_03515 [Streptomyces alboniger]
MGPELSAGRYVGPMSEWDIKKLQILRTLSERGTVTATARTLRMTPSAVSQQLSNLAKQLGVPLLEAHGRRGRATDAAHLVLRHAEAVFAQLERADAELAAYAHGEAGEVRVGAFSTAVPALVVPAVRALRSAAPGISVRVRETEAAEAYELLAAGEVDVALSLAVQAPASPDADPRFTRESLLADPLDVALPVRPSAGGGRGTAPRRPGGGAVDLRRQRTLVGHHAGGLRGRRVHARAGALRLRLDGDPRHGGGGDGGGAGPAHGGGPA